MTYWKTLYLSFFYFSISLFASNLDVFNKTARHMKFVLQLWYLVKLNGLIKVEKAWLKNTNLVLVTCLTNAWLSKASFQNMLRRIFFLNFPGERVNQYLPCSYCLICTQKSRYIISPILGWETYILGTRYRYWTSMYLDFLCNWHAVPGVFNRSFSFRLRLQLPHFKNYLCFAYFANTVKMTVLALLSGRCDGCVCKPLCLLNVKIIEIVQEGP